MVLSVRNRTENWKTAHKLAPLFRDPEGRLRLVEKLGEPEITKSSEVYLELFWKGLRDHLHDIKDWDGHTLSKDMVQSLAGMYLEYFPNLRDEIEAYRREERDKHGTFKDLKAWNYLVPDQKAKTKLGNNLYNTEIDIVIVTPQNLYIGEAKDESPFGASREDVLVHQLIRQYVMAHILLQCLGKRRCVIPFVVGRKKSELNRKSQVDFMIWKGWMKNCNVLSWSDIDNLYKQSS